MFEKLLENRAKYNYKELMNNYSWTGASQTSITNEDLLKESTYNKCVKYNAESVAKCPINITKEMEDAINHRLYFKLKLRPNPYMTIADCIKAWVALGEHEGISALFITPNKDLYPARIKEVVIDDAGVLASMKNNPVSYLLDIAGKEVIAFDKECIIYRSGISWDSLKSVNANKDYLKDTVKTVTDGQTYLSNLFANGLCSKVIVQLTSDLKDEKQLSKIQDKFNRLYSNNGKTFTVPAGYSVSALNMSLADNQFKEIRSLSRVEIANAFGLTPSMIGEGDGKTDIEMDMLRYLQDTLLFKLEAIEQEMNFKLLTPMEVKEGYKIKFNINVLLRTNAKTQQEIICEYVKQGVYSVEYARKVLGVNIPDTDTIVFPSGQILLKDLLEGKATWQTIGKGGGGDGKKE